MYYRVLSLFCSAALCFPMSVLAVVSNGFISTEQDTPIVIDLTVNVSTESTFSYLDISGPSTNGTALVTGAAEVTYTPNTGFTGMTDSFEYTAFDAAGNPLGTAVVTIGVGVTVLNGQNAISSAVQVSEILNTACVLNNGSPSSPDLVDICANYFNATAAERARIAKELAPREINGQNQLSSTVVAQQIDSIRKRLSAIRQSSTAVNPLSISFNLNRYPEFSLQQLLSNSAVGGAASADSTNSRTGVFVSANVGGGDYTPGLNSNDEGYEFSLHGFTLGSDYRLNRQTIVGGGLGISKSDMDINNNGGNLDISGINLLAYGSYYVSDATYLESILGVYTNEFTTKRNISYPVGGVLKNATASSDTENRVLSVSIGAGHETALKGGLTIVVSGNLDYIQSAVDGYVETGAGGANLSIDGRKESNLISSINWTSTNVISYPGGVLIPQLDIAWKHDFSAERRTVSGAFTVDVPNTGFSFETEESNADYLKLSAGLSYVVVGGGTGFVYIENTVGQRDFSEYNISLGMRLEL